MLFTTGVIWANATLAKSFVAKRYDPQTARFAGVRNLEGSIIRDPAFEIASCAPLSGDILAHLDHSLSQAHGHSVFFFPRFFGETFVHVVVATPWRQEGLDR
jgi:hypothetical protein